LKSKTEKQSFPPQTKNRSEVAQMVNILGSVVGNNAATYLSVPITSGKRYSVLNNRHNGKLDLSLPDHRDQHRREVIEPNIVLARLVSTQLRKTSSAVVIDPTGLEDVPGWTQNDYLFFWACVIKKFARKVVFIDGWQYSKGCSYEFLVAHTNRIKTYNDQIKPVTLNKGIRLIKQAMDELEATSMLTDFHEKIISELLNLQNLK
jgi:hypothetical protein